MVNYCYIGNSLSQCLSMRISGREMDCFIGRVDCCKQDFFGMKNNDYI